MFVPRSSARHLPSIWKRLSSSSASTSTFTAKEIPSKSHLHQPIPDSYFPKGYALTGLHCGVKKDPSNPDLAVLLSTSANQTYSAVCTTINAFKAAPVLVTKEIQEKTDGRARALVVNSGCANAVTGTKGMEDAWAMMRATDALLEPAQSQSQVGETLVMSTGVIGQMLPISKILTGIQNSRSTLGSAFTSWELFARGFMTTDTFPKLRARTFSIKGREYRMAGVDKGAGMIHPNMGPVGPPHATLLGCIATDAPVSPKSLSKALTYAVERSFNSISVDGDMSTNDTIVAFANGAAAEKGEVVSVEIDEARDEEAYIAFRDELTDFAQELAKLVVRDGEGATKFVTVSVEGAASYSDAHQIASRISTSALVKTALYGEDANWGRILAATGSLPSLSQPLNPSTVSVSFIPVPPSTPAPSTFNHAPLALLVNGEPENVDEVRAKEIVSQGDLEIRVELGMGKESAKYWTCDFSYEYVRINGDYRS